MISETITIPKTISDQEDRFVLKLKENLLRMIKEINKNSKKISEINGEEHEDPDYTDEFNKKADVNASNIGYGDLFLEIKDDEGEVIYSEEDNRKDWGKALTNSKNTIASDNVTLVSSQNVYDETHPYMEKDSGDHWINPYHYINYKNLSRREGAEDINKQDRWSEQEFFEPNEPNDNTVKENLVALDSAVWEVSEKLNNKANVSLDNINHTGGLVINAIARGSTVVQDRRAFGVQDPLVKVAYQEVQDPDTGLYTDVYTVYSDYDPGSGGNRPFILNDSLTIDIETDIYQTYDEYTFKVNYNHYQFQESSPRGLNLNFAKIKDYQSGDSNQRAVSAIDIYNEVNVGSDGNYIKYTGNDGRGEDNRYTTAQNLQILDQALYQLEARVSALEQSIDDPNNGILKRINDLEMANLLGGGS